jgi:SSS family solute:Na+ symporter
MQFIDWTIVVLFVLSSVGIGVYFTKKASQSEGDFFLAGRSLGWFVAGTSIVATTFSSDTPQWVAGHTQRFGIAGNWIWWCSGIGTIGAIFFLARYWRRSGIVTEVEFVRFRYGDSKSSNMLRIFKAVSDGIVVNCMVMASVTLAMAKVSKIVLGLSDKPLITIPLVGGVTPMAAILVILTIFVLVYSAMSGLYGVVYTDLFQFIMAMIGTIALAVIMYVDASGKEGGLVAALQAAPDFKNGMLDMIPDLSVWNIGTMLFAVNAGFLWIMAFPTGGFYVQRLLSTKNEKEATKAFLWFNFAHFVLRSWPWIIVGMLAMIYFPHLPNPEDSYAMAIKEFLPVGLKGLMVASFLAAFMSTMSTQLNWGTSYVVHDLYEAFINPKASKKNILMVSRVCMVGFTVIAGLIAVKLTSILSAYTFLMQLWAGVGLILVFRWYWWRITAGAEFIALLITAILIILLNIHIGSGDNAHLMVQGVYDWFRIDLFQLKDLTTIQIGWVEWAVRMIIFTFIPPVLWIPYVFLRTKKPNENAIKFYKKMRISSVGWKRVERETGCPSPAGELKMNLIGWLVTSLALYGVLLGTGSIIFHQWKQAVLYLPIGIVASWFTWKIMSGKTFSSLASATEETEEDAEKA